MFPSATSKTPSGTVLRILSAVWWISAVLFGITLLTGSGTKAVVEEGEAKYAVVIDAGSTGSRVHVYRYHDAYPIPAFDLTHEGWHQLKVKPGLSSFESNPEKAGKSLSELIDFARDYVPRSLRKETPIQLRGTAGLRKVRSTNRKALRAIMESVRKFLSGTEFKFQENWANVIDGTTEGKYGWITANYLNGFLEDSHVNKYAQSTGVLEMGGESVQLTFIPNDEHIHLVPTSMLTKFHFAGEEYNLFVHSWMGYGLEAAQARMDQNYYERENPCYVVGLEHEYARGKAEIVSFDMPERHIGTGNWVECYDQLADHIIESKQLLCSETEGTICSLDGIAIPDLDGENFYLIENFYYTSAFFGDDVLEARNYRDAIEDAGRKYCASEYE